MSKLTITASIIAQPEQLNRVKAELEQLMEPTRKEAGCIQYDLYQDDKTPYHFFMFENWETRQLWQAHLESDHFTQFVAATEGMIASLDIHEMTKIA